MNRIAAAESKRLWNLSLLIDLSKQVRENPDRMKPTIAIFLMLCLQVAMSPLCLCYGTVLKQELKKPTCCHAPAGEDPLPCPHCDQEMPISATTPEKSNFSANPPEWHGFDQFFGVDLFDLLIASAVESHEYATIRDLKPPPPDLCERYGVFQI